MTVWCVRMVKLINIYRPSSLKSHLPAAFSFFGSPRDAAKKRKTAAAGQYFIQERGGSELSICCFLF